MTDLLDRQIQRTSRPQTGNRASAPISPPPLAEPKELFNEIRSMVADEDFAANLSRAVVQSVRHWDLEPSKFEACEIDEYHDDWISIQVWSGSLAPVQGVGRVSAPSSIQRLSFLKRAKLLDERGQTDFALDLIFDQIDEMFLAGRFDRVDHLLRDTVTNDYSVEVILGILTATLPAKVQLPARSDFFQRANRTLKSRGELDETLLVGLE